MPSDPCLAQIILFAGNFAPAGWALCNGQILSINTNQALFSLLGTTYGGDGRTTFALPDLRGRAPVHAGSGAGPGLSNYTLGQKTGVEGVVLNSTQIPSHTHSVTTTVGGVQASPTSESSSPGGRVWAPSAPGDNDYGPSGALVPMDPNALQAQTTVANNGSSQSHTNIMPCTAINYIIALVGIFPSRN